MSMEERQENWNTGEKAGRVNIGNHHLWLSVHGTNRKPGEPLVIIIPGLASSTTGWASVRRLLSPFARVLQYERSGFGESDCSNKKPTASRIAQELDLLLQKASLHPPYVLVAHSWGGIISREFLALRPGDISGMVFIDANQERTLEVLDWRELAMSELLIGVDHSDATDISNTHKLNSDEWCTYQATQNTEQHKRQAELEFAVYPISFAVLKAKGQLQKETPFLNDRPVCVIRGDAKSDFEKLLQAGLARGNTDATKVTAFRDVLRTWDEKDRSLQSEMQLLSTTSRYIEVPNSGHNVHLTEPEAIVESVRWVLSHAQDFVS